MKSHEYVSAMDVGLRPVCNVTVRWWQQALFFIWTLACLLMWQCDAIAATGTLSSLNADAQVNQLAGVNSVSNLSAAFGYVGGGSGTQNGVVYVFSIPPGLLSDSTQRFSMATFTIKIGSTINPGTAVNGDLYGLGYSIDSTVLASDFFEGTLDTSNTLIQDNFITPSLASYSVISVTNSALLQYLNNILDTARADGVSTAYAFLRVSPDAYNYGNHYSIGMSEASSTYVPTISYETAYSSRWQVVPLGGGGYATGLISDNTGGALYARTDVGGVFRFNAASSQWSNITDTIVPVTHSNSDSLGGIASLAIDPSDPNRLFVAAGKTEKPALKGIYISTDRGSTWTSINSSIVMDGNGAYRTLGERLAVDPNDPNVVWYGSSQDGLQKGVYNPSTTTWTWTQISSTSVPFGQTPSGSDYAGVTFVTCDKNSGNTIVYAGVYDAVGSTGGIYRSTNGVTWSPVPGISLTKPARAQLAPNGTLYVTANGIVAKLARGGSLVSITPDASYNYRGVAVDQTDAAGNTVYVAECTSLGAENGRIWRSVNGGSDWAQQYATFNGTSGRKAKTEPDGTPSLTGGFFCSASSLALNPSNPNELWAGDFYGTLRTQNVASLGTASCSWYFLQKGMEETCVEALKNAPTGARLISGLADRGGFCYLSDTATRPTPSNGGPLTNPVGGSTTSLDFCESNPSVWVRAWINGAKTSGSGAISTDGGASWMTFGQIASATVTNSATDGWESWDLSAYLSIQKAKGVNTVSLILCSSNTDAFASNQLLFDSRECSDTTLRPKLVIDGSTPLIPTADAYVSGASSGTNYGSTASLAVSYAYGTVSNSTWSCLKFDLSSVASVTTASLRLHRPASTNTISYTVGVYATEDNSWTETGVTWANRPAPLAGSANPVGSPIYKLGGKLAMGGRVAISATDPNRMVWLPVIGTNVGNSTMNAYYSKDRGVTWSVCAGAPLSLMKTRDDPSAYITQLASDRVNGKFYMAKFGGASHLIYASSDGGENWSQVGACAAGTYNIYRAQLVAAPAENELWLCDDGVNGTSAGGLWKSTTGGASWSKISGLTSVRQVSFGRSSSGTGYPGTGYTVFIHGYKNGVKGIYRSDDYGSTWQPLEALPTGIGVEAIGGDRQTYGKVFIGTGGRGTFEYRPD